MSGPFYARYVPPKAKPAEQPAPPSNPVSPVIQRSTDNANPARAQLFARYVPPKPSRPAPSQRQLSREKEAEEENIQDRSTKEREAKKNKKDRKEKSKKRSKAHEEEQEHNEDAAEFGRTENTGPDGDGDQIMKDISQDEEEESSASEREEKPRKAPKREKKRKRRDEEQKDGEGDEDDTHLKKHKSILSKFEKSSKISDVLKQTAPEGDDQPQEPVELHDLVPLPQPEPVPEAEYKPTFSALPSWLSRPTVISSQTRTPFSSLNIHPKLMDQIEGKGFKEAFAVQSGLIPLLLPGPQQHIGDVCVSAATGSGKTLGYVLPLIQNLRERVVIKLRGLIVVPTRELVTQAKEVAELCAVGTGIKIGTALGNQSFPSEQAALVKTVNRYDPEGYEELQVRGKKELLSNGSRDEQLLEDCAKVLPNHTLSFESNVDILICTPGRLVDHIRATRGFSLRDVQWLVIDEADRLLDQSFQEWAETLINAVEAKQAQQELSVRDQIVAQLGYPEDKQAVKKIILSATMTRDLAKLSALKLRRPKMLIVQDQDKLEQAYEQGAVPDSVTQAEAFEIPRTLREFAMPVGDGTEKALFLLHLLQSRILHGQHDATSKRSKGAIRKRRSASVSSASSSSSDDSTCSDSSGSSVSSDSTDSSISSDSSDSSDAETSASSDSGTDRDATPKKSAPGHQAKVLIFTKDNENASRLSHLLAKLHPPYAGIIGTLTKSSATSAGRKVLAAFRSGKTWLLIASDRASRGLDVPDLTHIVNYDIPRSVTAYVHRVGRTARAGKSGDAWTFFTNAEGKWFWNAIARAPEIKRNGGKVVRVKPEANAITEDMRAAYGAALQELQLAVQGNATDAHR